MSSFKTVQVTLGADVADAGTFTVTYPSGNNVGDFAFARGHYLSLNGKKLRQPADIGLAFGAASVTVTNRTGGTLPAGSTGVFQFEISGEDAGLYGDLSGSAKRLLRTQKLVPVKIVLGAPIAADPDGLVTSVSQAAGTMALTGALVSGGVAILDVPRALVVDSGGADTAVITITGTDEYGATMVESITLNGLTAVNGKKAFKTVTGITNSATISNGAFVGTTDILGLPVAKPAATTGGVIKELEDDAVATAGTFVAALAKNTESTATSADVRGTYLPNSAADGAKTFALEMVIADPFDLGNPQYAG